MTTKKRTSAKLDCKGVWAFYIFVATGFHFLDYEANTTAQSKKLASSELFDVAAYLYSVYLVDEDVFIFPVEDCKKAPVFPYWKLLYFGRID